MSTPILNYQPAGGVPIPGIPIPAEQPIYSQTGSTPLIEGQEYIDVVFGSLQTDADWVLLACEVENTTDLEPLNIWPGIVTDRSVGGFRIQLNGMPDSGNYYLHWAVSGINVEPSPASTYFLTGPSSGGLSVASTNFTVALPPSTTLDAPVTVTPDDGGGGGTFTPTSVVITTGSPSQTFTYTPASYGAKTISVTNTGPLSDPASLVYTVVASTYTFSGPSGGVSGVPSTNFTVALPVGGSVIGTVTVTPHDALDGGTFTPTTVGLTTAAPSATFTYTPASGGAKTLSVTNDGGLTNPGNLTYTATVPVTPHLLNTLISYWKMDETQPGGVNVPRVDSQGTNNLDDPLHCLHFGGANAKINNALYCGGAGGGNSHLNKTSNSSLQVTSDFTFSLWVRVDGGGPILWKGEGSTGVDYSFIVDATYGWSFMAYVPAVGINGSIGVSTGLIGLSAALHHFVLWYDSSDSKVRIRVDDTTTYTSAGTTTLIQTTNDFIVGILQYGGGPAGTGFQGMVDEVGFWKRVLTAQEITALYNAGAGLPFSSFTA